MAEAILGAPYEEHSDEFRTKLVADVEYILFVDGGLAVKRDGKWTVEFDGPMNEASAFVSEQ